MTLHPVYRASDFTDDDLVRLEVLISILIPGCELANTLQTIHDFISSGTDFVVTHEEKKEQND